MSLESVVRRVQRARRTMPKSVQPDEWTLPELQEHLQYAVDLEFWTIPFYMAAMYSIRDQASEAAQLVKTVVNQEMLHMQLAANVANAFGCDVCVDPPVYGQGVPHLDFSLDRTLPPFLTLPADSRIGPMDAARRNTMCLIEYPDQDEQTVTNPDVTTYPSIGDFYASVAIGVDQLSGEIIGNRRQVDLFRHFYDGFAQPTVTRDGDYGLPQVQGIIQAIVTQGEGEAATHALAPRHRNRVPAWYGATVGFVPPEYQNTATDLRPSWDHYEKFASLFGAPLPAHYTASPGPNPAGREAQVRLLRTFVALCDELEALFRGGSSDQFGPLMYRVGANVVSCWANGATPVFTPPTSTAKA